MEHSKITVTVIEIASVIKERRECFSRVKIRNGVAFIQKSPLSADLFAGMFYYGIIEKPLQRIF